MDWQSVYEWMMDNPEEALNNPIGSMIFDVIIKKHQYEWDKLDGFKKASLFKQISLEMPDIIESKNKLASPLREETLCKLQMFLQILISRENLSEPERISLDHYKQTLENYIKKIEKLIPKVPIPFDYLVDPDFNIIEHPKTKQKIDLFMAGSQMFAENQHCLKLNDGILIYNKAIKVLLTRQIAAQNKLDPNETSTNIQLIKESYKAGFKAGVEYFIQNHTVSNDTLYGITGKDYKRNLHNLYYHHTELKREGGWRLFLIGFSHRFNSVDIYRYGYYAGIVSQLELVKSKHSSIFHDFEKHIEATEQINKLPPQQTATKKDKLKAELDNYGEGSISALQWATIFYYAREVKQLESGDIHTQLSKFMSDHKVTLSKNSVRNKYYEAKKRINIKIDYPITKLKSLLPFLRENYNQVVAKVENDIIFLQNKEPD